MPPTLDPYSITAQPQPMGHLMDSPPDPVPTIPGLSEPLPTGTFAAEQAQQSRQFQQQGIAAQEHQLQNQQQQQRIAAAGVAAQIATDPSTKGKAFYELDPELQRRIYAAHPAIAPEIPGLVNNAQTAATGRPVGAKLLPDETATAKVGDMSITGIIPQQEAQIDPKTWQPIASTSNLQSMAQMVADLDLPMSVLGRLPPQTKMRVLTGAAAIAQARGQEFNAQNYEAQQKARDSFQPGGKNGQSILSANTVIDHFGQLHDLVDSLGNFTGGPGLNYGYNAIRRGIGGNTAIPAFETAANTAATEYAKMLAGGVPNESEIKHYQAMLSPNLGPQQLKQNIQQMAMILGSKTRELQNEWDATVKKPRDIPFITPKSNETLQKMGVNPALIDPKTGATTQSTQGPQQATPQPSAQDQFQTGKTYFDKAGNRAVYMGNGQWK